MITKAIVKDGGIFIPNVERVQALQANSEIEIQFTILGKEDIFQKSSGILKGKNIDPLQFQEKARNE